MAVPAPSAVGQAVMAGPTGARVLPAAVGTMTRILPTHPRRPGTGGSGECPPSRRCQPAAANCHGGGARALPAALAPLPLPEPRGHGPPAMAVTSRPAAIPEPTAPREPLPALPPCYSWRVWGWRGDTRHPGNAGSPESWHPAGRTGVTPGPPAVPAARPCGGPREWRWGGSPRPGLHPSGPHPEWEAPGPSPATDWFELVWRGGSWAGAGLAAPGAGRRGHGGRAGRGRQERAGASRGGRRCWGVRPSHRRACPRPHPRGAPAAPRFPRPRGLAASCSPARGRAGSPGVSGWRPLSHPARPGMAAVPTQHRPHRDPPTSQPRGREDTTVVVGPAVTPCLAPLRDRRGRGDASRCPTPWAGDPAVPPQLWGPAPVSVCPELCHQAVGHMGAAGAREAWWGSGWGQPMGTPRSGAQGEPPQRGRAPLRAGWESSARVPVPGDGTLRWGSLRSGGRSWMWMLRRGPPR